MGERGGNSRWHHAPVLHTAQDAPRAVGWLEILFDLGVASSVVLATAELQADTPARTAAVVFACLWSLWAAWSTFTAFSNRFRLDDVPHRAVLLVVVLAVGGMGLSVREACADQVAAFAISAALAFGGLAICHVRAAAQCTHARRAGRMQAMALSGVSAAFAATAVLPSVGAAAVWAVALVALAAVGGLPVVRDLDAAYPRDRSHLHRRFGVLLLLVLGASIVRAQTGLAERTMGVELLVRAGFALVLALTIWWMYFDDVAGRRLRAGAGHGVVWRAAHMPLVLCVALLGSGLERLAGAPLWEPGAASVRWLLAVGLAGALGSVAVIDALTERYRAELSDRTRVGLRAVSALVLIAGAQALERVPLSTFLAAVAALCLVQIAADMLLTPFEPAVDDADDNETSVLGTGERVETAESVRRAERSPPVQLGGRSAARRDLYFFLMDGSWSRVVLAFAMLYIAINLVFAGLYQLDSRAIAHAQGARFWDAFHFSVQTLTTLGYGAMAPGSAWGNAVVAVEAAVGVLFVALATGVMFAKASRPRSGVVWSTPIVITVRNGVPTLEFRVANSRGNDVVDASMNVSILIDEVTAEGHRMGRLHDLELVRSRSPLFRLSWTVMHTIDEDSPLSRPEVLENLRAIVASMTAHDSTYAQTIYDRHTYSSDDIAHGRRFVDIVHRLPDGRFILDLDRIDDTEPDGLSAAQER